MKRVSVGLVVSLVVGLAAADMPQGLVLRFSCDEFRNNGTMVPDVTGSNNNGRVSGARYASSGRLNGGCEFTGKNSYIQVPASPLLDSKQVAFCLWFKTAKAEWPDRTLVDKRADSGYALRLAAGDKQSGRKGKLYATVCGRDVYSDAPVADNAWHHAAVTCDGENVKLYVDGIRQQQTAAVAGHGAGASGEPLTLGMNRSNPTAKDKEAAFEGALDEVLVFNRALTDAEVRDAIAATKPKFTKQQVERRLRELEDLRARGLILQDFYERKVKECEVSP